MTLRFSVATAGDGRSLRRSFRVSGDRVQYWFDCGSGRSKRFTVEVAIDADFLPIIAAQFSRRCFSTGDQVEQKRSDARAFLRGEQRVETDAAVIRDFAGKQSGMRSFSHAGKQWSSSATVGGGVHAHTRFLSLGRTKAHVSYRNVEHDVEPKGATPDLLRLNPAVRT